MADRSAATKGYAMMANAYHDEHLSSIWYISSCV